MILSAIFCEHYADLIQIYPVNICFVQKQVLANIFPWIHRIKSLLQLVNAEEVARLEGRQAAFLFFYGLNAVIHHRKTSLLFITSCLHINATYYIFFQKQPTISWSKLYDPVHDIILTNIQWTTKIQSFTLHKCQFQNQSAFGDTLFTFFVSFLMPLKRFDLKTLMTDR